MENSLVATVERWLDLLYIGAPGARLRVEDHRKVVEVAAMLEEVERMLRRLSRKSPVLLVDAAAGKSYVGLLAARFVLEPIGRAAAVVTIERDQRRVALSRQAAERLGTGVPIDCRCARVADASAWPDQPSIVTALHACGPAADDIIERAIQCRAKGLLLVPCCTGKADGPASRALKLAVRCGVPHQAAVRRRFVQAAVDAERTLSLEAAGYQTEVVEFVGATTTPHNLLWRARRVGEPRRMQRARHAFEHWRTLAGEEEYP